MKKRNMIIILIILLTVGFASVSTTLVLNGTIGIGVDKDDFNVIFTEALLDGEESSQATIGSDKKTITFNTDKLTNVGDTTELVYKVKNNSTQYGANVTMACNTIGNEYVSITSTFDSQPLPLAIPVLMGAQEVRMGRITAELIKGYTGENGSIEISCSLIAKAESKEEYSYTVNFDSSGGSSVDDKIVTYNGSYGELPTPERGGYAFLGWYDENNQKIETSSVIDTKGNKTLYAKWEVTCPYEVGQEWVFEYTGGEQTFTSPCVGNYKMEVWGAQGGASNEEYIGGYGGYASGVTSLDYHTNAYVNVGGMGETNSTPASAIGAKGGYNGGGTGNPESTVNHLYGAGGGATHVALKSGLLSTLENNKDKILIVAGGGGGGRWQKNWEDNDLAHYGYGGSGGGFIGGYGTDKTNLNATGGGTQTGSILVGGEIGSFGKGASIVAQGAGGGGFYGGNAYPTGGGGSGYIGNSLLTNKGMYCYNCTESTEESTKTTSTTCTSSDPTANCAKQDNGYAKITYLGY